MSWKQTYTGLQFWPENPTPDMIDPLDIAHALSLTCRFNGACRQFYSVAQHSVLVSLQMPTPTLALWGLLHDGAEAYLSDVPSPIKPLLTGFTYLEQQVLAVIAERFDLPGRTEPAQVKHVDRRMLATEQRDLMGPPPEPWPSTHGTEPYAMEIHPIPPAEAEALFLDRFSTMMSAKMAEEAARR